MFELTRTRSVVLYVLEFIAACLALCIFSVLFCTTLAYCKWSGAILFFIPASEFFYKVRDMGETLQHLRIEYIKRKRAREVFKLAEILKRCYRRE